MIGDTDVSEMCVAMKISPMTSWNHPGLGIWGPMCQFLTSMSCTKSACENREVRMALPDSQH